MTLRLVTWNINSVRIRLDSVARLVADEAPDVLCLQETKVEDGLFPRDALHAMGFVHVELSGQKNYNGVAVLSRVPLDGPARIDWCARGDCRHIAVRLPQGVEVHNCYVPAGGDVTDPDENPKFAHKLAFLDEMIAWSGQSRGPSVLVGDLNVAPLETDVWSHKQLLKVVSHTPAEVERMTRMQEAGRWVDAVRHFVPPEHKLYSWWSYRAKDWDAADKGRRLDHVWVTPDLRASLRGARILRHARGWERASDHVPVVVDLDL